VPGDRILVETDTPYLAPQPVRGRANEPMNVHHTLAAVAQAREDDLAALEAQIDANATAAFDLADT
jgi:TatD DNase family protein